MKDQHFNPLSNRNGVGHVSCLIIFLSETNPTPPPVATRHAKSQLWAMAGRRSVGVVFGPIKV